MAMALFTFLLCIGASIRIAQSSPCHAQCTYDRVTGKADCSSRNLDCIPVNYPDSLVMDLSHNNISILEPADFNRTFTRLVEIYLDYNNIYDVTSLMTSTEMGSLKKLSVQHNVIVHLDYSCGLDSLEDISLDNNMINSLYEFPHCQRLRRFSADSNEFQHGISLFVFDSLPSFISMRFNRITYFHIGTHFPLFLFENLTLLLNHNEISDVHIEYHWHQINPTLISLSYNRLQYVYVPAPNELIIANNGLRGLNIGIWVYQRENNIMRKLDVRSNSFDCLIQPDWAEGLLILHANGNLLRNLSSTTLQGFVNLTELHLANNRLLFIYPTALHQLTLLRSLYLDDNALTSLFGGVFLNQADLLELSITNNQLSVLHPDYFFGLGSLERLYLAGNRLLDVNPEIFRLMPGLTTIDFSQNDLNIFDITDSNLLEIFGALSRLELEGNPLQCDCRLTGLRDWLLNNPPSTLPRCQGPPKNSGTVVTDLGIHDLSCNPPKAMIKKNHLNLTVGQTATLSCTATGIPIPNITWLDPNGTMIQKPTVSFHHRKAYHSDGGYVNKVNDDQCVESAANRSGREDDYEVTVRTNDPPQVYQELALQNKDDEYESVSGRGGQ
ncbi:peroxidasin homolog [Acanthaster planci]|uniref:Peroxidasin homolog n=1 Tax=Acanthaster planci TaxID=133434 RepID=A0A8B7ZJF7_ACAPL|nr:peroxidasin homolog [Acanthaster planci]